MVERIFENANILSGTDLELVKGYVRVVDGVIKEISEGSPDISGVDVNGGFLIPPFVNAHTHVGGSCRREIYSGSAQQDVVGPDGLKFRSMESSTDEEKLESIREILAEIQDSGTAVNLDFRENGLEGVRLLRRALNDRVKTFILSRPTSGGEIVPLLEESDGFGIPSLDYLTEQKISEASSEASKRNKIFTVHVSETRKAQRKSLKLTGETEIARALRLNPSFLVHGTWANREDLCAMADRKVPLVLCPRANSLLSVGLPPIAQAIEKGVQVWLGTDNVFLNPPNMLREISYAWSILRLQTNHAGSEEAKELLKAATVNPISYLDLSFGPVAEGKKAAFLILSKNHNLNSCEDPYMALVNRAQSKNIVSFYRPTDKNLESI